MNFECWGFEPATGKSGILNIMIIRDSQEPPPVGTNSGPRYRLRQRESAQADPSISCLPHSCLTMRAIHTVESVFNSQGRRDPNDAQRDYNVKSTSGVWVHMNELWDRLSPMKKKTSEVPVVSLEDITVVELALSPTAIVAAVSELWWLTATLTSTAI